MGRLRACERHASARRSAGKSGAGEGSGRAVRARGVRVSGCGAPCTVGTWVGATVGRGGGGGGHASHELREGQRARALGVRGEEDVVGLGRARRGLSRPSYSQVRGARAQPTVLLTGRWAAGRAGARLLLAEARARERVGEVHGGHNLPGEVVTFRNGRRARTASSDNVRWTRCVGRECAPGAAGRPPPPPPSPY